MQIINLTPHVITLQAADGSRTNLSPRLGVDNKPNPARVSSTPGALRQPDGCPVPVAAPTVFGEVVGVPGPVEGVLYVASALVAQAARRADVVSPGTGPADGAIRNDQNQIEAVTRLVAWV